MQSRNTLGCMRNSQGATEYGREGGRRGGGLGTAIMERDERGGCSLVNVSEPG